VAQALGSEKSVSPAPPKVTSKRRWICYAGIHYASRQSIPTPGLPPARHAALWAADEGHGGSTSFELSAVSLKYLVTHPSHHLSPVTDCPRPLAALTQDRQGMLSPYASPQFVLSLASCLSKPENRQAFASLREDASPVPHSAFRVPISLFRSPCRSR